MNRCLIKWPVFVYLLLMYCLSKVVINHCYVSFSIAEPGLRCNANVYHVAHTFIYNKNAVPSILFAPN